MKILDLSAGNRAIWYDRNYPLCTFLDKRAEVNPDFVCDTRSIPKEVGSNFDLIVWDPPHMNCGPNSNMSKNYGYHKTKDILDTVHLTAKEAHRISRPEALMALKWNSHDISLKRILALIPQWEPLFGHIVKRGGSKGASETYWVMLKRKDFIENPTLWSCE